MFRPRSIVSCSARALLITVCALSLGADGLAGTAEASVVFNGLRDRPVIALTIDDGGSTSACRSMARTLRDDNVTATFFPTSAAVRAHPRFWSRVAQSFPMGNHTVSHVVLTALNRSEIVSELRRAEEAIETVTGRPILHVLRPPGGAQDTTVRRAAAEVGYPVVLIWDTSAGDTSLNSRPSGMIRSALRGRPGSVLLMHCNRQVSADILPPIISAYRERGYRFVTVEALLARMGFSV